jgi:uncharacterized protein
VAVKTARASLLAFVLCWAVVAGAQVPVPPLGGRVTDQTSTLTDEQKSALERALRSFEARKGSQVAILIVPSTAPETIEQYALRVAEQWKPGRKNVDDGALLVVAKDDRTLRIEVGYGLEGALTDAASKRIISEIIVPRFRQGDFYGGISAGVDRILRVIDGEPLPEPERRPAGTRGIGAILPVMMILALVVGGVLHTVLGRFPGALVTGGAVSVVAWMLAGAISVGLIAGVIAFLFTLLGGGMGGRGLRGGGLGGGFGGGGFGGGGFGGGGFSGGGGGFGGGGASGRW